MRGRLSVRRRRGAGKIPADRAVGGVAHLTEPPSTYVRDRVYGCIVQDDFGIAIRGGILGVDQLTFESDYPHTDSTWPKVGEFTTVSIAA